jgi:hypothetical protein
MTMSEFDTLRADLAALRADIDVRFARLEAKIDEKPSAATIYQASLTMFAVMIGTIIVLKSISVIP